MYINAKNADAMAKALAKAKNKKYNVYAWSCHGEFASLIVARDEEDAYEQAIKHRMESCDQTRKEAEGWYEEEDFISHVDGVILED